MITIVKYNSGNTRSLMNALQRIGCEAVLTDNPQQLQQAEKVIFPGVGAAGTAMQHLRERGLVDTLQNLQQPFLGICLGMQLMCEHSEENDTAMLGIFPNQVERFKAVPKIPHMGWNELEDLRGPLFAGITEHEHAYFVHSYRVELNQYTSASTHYGSPFSAALQRDNFYGLQFHPEKSGEAGEQILKNFLSL